MEISPDDLQTVLRARTGDLETLARLVETHRPWIQHVVGRFIRDGDAVQDVMQDSYIEAQRSIRGLKNPEKFGAWLCGIALNLARRRIADASRTTAFSALNGGMEFESFEFEPAERDPAKIAEEREAFGQVVEAIAGLPDTYQSAVALFYLRQLSVQEVSSVLGISAGAVKVRLHRAREMVKEKLNEFQGSAANVGRNKGCIASRRKSMVKVRIVDVVDRSPADQATGSRSDLAVVALADESGRRALPIWIGRREGAAIALGVHNQATPRPLTYETFGQILRAADVEITSVEISKLEDSIYHANVVARTATGSITVDARPSDALALAVQFGAPIHVADDVMNDAGIDIDSGQVSDDGGKSMNSLIAEVTDPDKWRAPHRNLSREECERSTKELIEKVFGA